MASKIYKLSFLTPVRFGLMTHTASQFCVHSDTLFSALFLALMETGEEKAFLDSVREGRLLFSDAMPYRGEELYLPRPVGVYPRQVDAETDPGTRKLLKKIHWVPLNRFQDWLSGIVHPEELIVRFGSAMERTRVNRRGEEPVPYQVEGFRFDADCGLYLIVRTESEKELNLFDRGMRLLTAAGIGGLKSSGWGKFTVSVQEVPDRLKACLENDSAGCQMLLSVAMPAENEGEQVVPEANYVLVQRGGYTAASGEAATLKQTVWLFAPGSTCAHRFSGDVLDISTNAPHPVWRCAKAMMMGVNAG